MATNEITSQTWNSFVKSMKLKGYDDDTLSDVLNAFEDADINVID